MKQTTPLKRKISLYFLLALVMLTARRPEINALKYLVAKRFCIIAVLLGLAIQAHGGEGGYVTTEGFGINMADACNLSAYNGASILSSTNLFCADSEFTLSVDADDNPNVLYKWQTSTDGITWVDVTNELMNTDFSSLPENTTLGGAGVSVNGGELVLTQAVNSSYGSLIVQSTPGKNMNAFYVNFDYRIWDGNGADGLSLSFGPDIDNGQGGGETGEGSGIRICLDTYNNNGGAAGSQIYIYYNKNKIWTNTVGAFDLRNAGYRNVSIQVNDLGQLSLKIKGTEIFSGLSLPGYTNSDKSNWKFKLSARTGGLNDKHSIDNLKIEFDGGATLTHLPGTTSTYYRAIVSCGGASVLTDKVQVIPAIHTNKISMP